ncbi:TIGR02453 family protein [Kordiimonas marina]|uniref:TIGR02453 family protein n=1 Tax=Kordiimonas marina TaxID=2872312 RepID=UPI001FF3E099|nr:DUF2461 domain-containing protein [Kordiimonas marina]MCJ9429525.1 DUF2461 domain-containing protein [Kordiimonas marina]
MTSVYFPAAGIRFLQDLADNNSRDWFEANRARYEADVKAPATFLAEAVAIRFGDRLGTPLSHKIFRVPRDLRFTKDKTPYNTHLRFAFWPKGKDSAQPAGGPALYMSIEGDRHVCGAGAILFPDDKLATYRTHISDRDNARKLAGLISGLAQSGFRFDEPELKRPPAGMVTSPENATLVRRKGLVAWHETPHADTPKDISLTDCLRRFELALPLYNWVKAL